MSRLYRYRWMQLLLGFWVISGVKAIGYASALVEAGQSERVLQSHTVGIAEFSFADGMDSLALAQKNKVALNIANCQEPHTHLGWANYSPDGSPLYDDQLGVSGETPISHPSPGQAVIAVTPLRLGHLKLIILLMCGSAIGGKIEAEVTVYPPKEAPEEFYAGDPWPTEHKLGVVTIELGKTSKNRITFFAKYSQSPKPAVITGRAITFSVINPEGADPVIDADRDTGHIRGLATGHALLEADFEGKRDFTCVNVVAYLNPPQPEADCAELLPAGQASLRRKVEGDLRPASPGNLRPASPSSNRKLQ